MLTDTSNIEPAIITQIVGSIIAGLVCGIYFTLSQRSMATGLKIVIGIVAVVGCGGVAFMLGFLGCALVSEVSRI